LGDTFTWTAFTWTNNGVGKSRRRHLETITDVERDEVRFCVFWEGVVFYSGTTSVMGAKNYTVYVYVQMLQWYLPPTLPTFYFRLTRHYPHWRVRVLKGLGYRDPDPYPVYPDPEPVRVVYTLDNH